jgi:hypothetical protein
MRLFILLISTFAVVSCSAQKPTKADIEKALRGRWDRQQTSSNPKQSITIQSIKIGTGAKANLQDKIDGIPSGAMVTIAQIDFTTRQYYNDQTVATHRIMIAKVYKDQFGEWEVMNSGMKTSDTKNEPKG